MNTVPDFIPNRDNVIWKKFKAPEKSYYKLSSEREMDILTKPGTVFTTLHFSSLTNGPNKLECYITLSEKACQGQTL